MTANEQIQELLKRARKAQETAACYSQERVDELCRAVARAGYDTAAEMAKLAVEETGMGTYEYKLFKNEKTAKLAWWYVRHEKSVGIVDVDEKKQIVTVAKPAGVVASILPSTNPTATPVGNGVHILKGRNAAIFAPHPKAKKCSSRMVEIMREALKAHGAPEDLFQVIEEPTVELSQLLMASCDVSVATGGPGMVKAAYSSGKPAFGVGQGNVQVFLGKEYKDIEGFTKASVGNRIYDNGMPCTCDQSIFVPEERLDEIIAAYEKAGAFYIDDEEISERLRQTMFKNGLANREYVGASAQKIAAAIDVKLPEGTKTLLVRNKNAGEGDLLSKEIMAPVMRLHTYTEFKDAVEEGRKNYLLEGAGHSTAVYSDNDEEINYVGERIPVCRCMVNQVAANGGGGAFENGLYHTNSLGCGFWGGNVTSENLTFRQLMNYTKISRIIPDAYVPSDEEIWTE